MGHKDELESFTKQENDEMDRIMLWDLKEDIEYFDECDLAIVRLCMKTLPEHAVV